MPKIFYIAILTEISGFNLFFPTHKSFVLHYEVKKKMAAIVNNFFLSLSVLLFIVLFFFTLLEVNSTNYCL